MFVRIAEDYVIPPYQSPTILTASSDACLNLSVGRNEVVVDNDEILELWEHLVAETSTINNEALNGLPAFDIRWQTEHNNNGANKLVFLDNNNKLLYSTQSILIVLGQFTKYGN